MSRTPPPARRRPLGFESLEDREVPAVIYAVTQSQRLQAFDSSNPAALLGAVSLRGAVDAGEKITDIDVRPVNGLLYGRSDHARIYTIDVVTGQMTPFRGQPAVGASVAIDFDPTTDLLRVTTFSGGNFAINPNDGSVASVGSPLNYAPSDPAQGFVPRLGGLGFTNSFPFSTFTQAYGIDFVRDTVVNGINGPDSGTYSSFGPLGINVTNNVGLDFDPATNVAYASFQIVGTSGSVFGRINTFAGGAIVIGPVGSSAPLVLDVAVARAVNGTGIPLPPPVVPAQFNAALQSPNVIQPLVAANLASPNIVQPLTTISQTSPLSSTLIQPLAPGLVSPLFSASDALTFSSTLFGTSFGASFNPFGTGFGALGFTGF